MMTLVQRLREAARTGLDLSPGDPLCAEAADMIDHLRREGVNLALERGEEDRPSMPELMMDVARLMARRSTCARLQVGCVISDLGMTTIYSIGYNGNYRGGPNECDRADAGDCGCLHAEDNALVKLRTETKNLMLFTTHSPCSACAKRIVNQGNIRTVWYGEHYRLSEEPQGILHEGGVKAILHGAGEGSGG